MKIAIKEKVIKLIILTIQSLDLDTSKRVFADPNKCNHKDNIDVYIRLFNDYNHKKSTNYCSFFWGFSNLRNCKTLEECVRDALSKIGSDCKKEQKVLILDVPYKLCLLTNFYNFTDEIFAYRFPGELESIWDSIYKFNLSDDIQVIYPYIDPEFVINEYLVSDVIKEECKK